MLAPASIAVIGASARPGNLGGDTVDRLVRFRFPGPIWPVNRSRERVCGLTAYGAVGELPGVPDLVVFAIPADALCNAIRECVAVGARHGVAYAGGLAESGQDAGIRLQRELVALCAETGFTLCGPNCVGFIHTGVPVTATFATALHEVDVLAKGGISLVTQSGGIATNAMTIIFQAGFGIRSLISSGNEAVVSFADYIRALAKDDGTRVIATYAEGVTDGPSFVAALEEARREGKPVVMIKSGATRTSAQAAKAHTGALVGDDKVFDAVLQETGVIRVWSVEELVDVSLLIAGMPQDSVPAGRGVGVVTFGGGNGVLAADQAARYGLTTPQLSAACVDTLRPLLVSVATAANPLDLTPTTAFRPEGLAKLPAALDVLAAEPQIHSLMVIVGSLASRGREIAEVIRGLHERCAKPVSVVWPSPPARIVEELAAHGIVTFLEPARALRALGHVVRRRELVASARGPVERSPVAFDWGTFVPERGSGIVVPEHRCHDILAAAGLAVAPGVLARTRSDALSAAQAIGYPVVLKGISPAVTHRAAAGLLAVDLRSDGDVAAAFDALGDRAAALRVTLDGIYVQKMAKHGSELLVAALRDPIFGTMVSVGVGGGLTELVNDVVTRRAPVDEASAAEMIARLRSYPHLRRDADAAAGDAAAVFVAAFSQLAASAPWRKFVFEVNPIRWTRDAAVAIDGLLIVEED